MASTTASGGGAPASVALKVNLVCWLLFALGSAFLGLRVFCKFKTHRGLWWDDHILIASWAFLLISTALTSYNLSLGFGRHVADIDPADLSTIGLVSNIDSTFSMLAAVLSKTSFAVTLLRITTGYTKLGVWLVIVVMNVAMDLSALFYWIQCNPPRKSWDPTTPGTCWSTDTVTAYSIFAAAISAAGDAALSFLPWKVVWSLQMKTNEKLGVALAMSMGIFAAGTAIVKCTKLPELADSDATFLAPEVAIWASAEVSTTIMAACIPVLRVLLNYIRSSAQQYVSPAGPSGSNFKGTGAVTTVIATTNTTARDHHHHHQHQHQRTKTGAGGHRVDNIDDDSGSDKSILERANNNQIVQTSEFTVEFHNHGRRIGGGGADGHHPEDSEPESVGVYEMTSRVRELGGEAV